KTEEDCLFDSFLRDAAQFTLVYRSVIEKAPLQIYTSALTYTPRMSTVIKQHFSNQVPHWIKQLPNVEGEQNPLQQAPTDLSNSVMGVAFSPDGAVLASSLFNGTVKLYD